MEANLPSPPAAISAMPRKSGTPKVMGILNVVFGSALLLGGICCGLYVMMLAAMSPMMGAAQNQVQLQVKATQAAERAAELQKLEEQEQAAQTEEEKENIRTQRQALESTPIPAIPAMPDMTKMYGMKDPRVIAYSLTDMLSGVLLNIFLVISGAGLIGMKEWGRKMAITVAGIKVGRLVVLEFFSIFVIVPVVAKQMAEAMQEMMAQMPPGSGGAPSPNFAADFAKMYGAMMTVSAACMLLFGSIYPGIVLWFLTRPDARAACQGSERVK